MFYESAQEALAQSIAAEWTNGSLPEVHRKLRGKPSLAAATAKALMRFYCVTAARTFLTYVAGNPSIFDTE